MAAKALSFGHTKTCTEHVMSALFIRELPVPMDVFDPLSPRLDYARYTRSHPLPIPASTSASKML